MRRQTAAIVDVDVVAPGLGKGGIIAARQGRGLVVASHRRPRGADHIDADRNGNAGRILHVGGTSPALHGVACDIERIGYPDPVGYDTADNIINAENDLGVVALAVAPDNEGINSDTDRGGEEIAKATTPRSFSA